MREQRTRFRMMALFLIALLLVSGFYGVYSISAYGSRWFGSVYNTRYRAARDTVIPGDVQDCNGVVLASSGPEGRRTYHASQEMRSAMVHIIGDPDGYIGNAVDSFQASYLWGFQTGLKERVDRLFTDEKPHGDNITLTVDSQLQLKIMQLLNASPNTAGRGAAVVVINYRTGAVHVLLSMPCFDPLGDMDAIKSNAQKPFFNRALQALQPPGSTFKIITAASLLENMSDATSMVFDCETGVMELMGGIVDDYAGGRHGDILLDRAFRVSCNNAFAQAALKLGDRKLRRTAENFGFNDNFLFRDLVVYNSVYPKTGRSDLAVAWTGVGQSKLQATPMHMCMVAAAIANEGVMMEPRLLEQVVSPMGMRRLSFQGSVYRTACSVAVANQVELYMKDVVANGTGKAAAVPGLSIAGKTGSAQSNADGTEVTHSWFVGYLDEPLAPYALCVFVEEGGNGGEVAAPIAGQIFRWLGETCLQDRATSALH